MRYISAPASLRCMYYGGTFKAFMTRILSADNFSSPRPSKLSRLIFPLPRSWADDQKRTYFSRHLSCAAPRTCHSPAERITWRPRSGIDQFFRRQGRSLRKRGKSERCTPRSASNRSNAEGLRTRIRKGGRNARSKQFPRSVPKIERADLVGGKCVLSWSAEEIYVRSRAFRYTYPCALWGQEKEVVPK